MGSVFNLRNYTIKIVCSYKGCPRTRIVDREETDPPMAVKMKISCPWHEKSGEFETPSFFDKDDNEIFQVGENEYEIHN